MHNEKEHKTFNNNRYLPSKKNKNQLRMKTPKYKKNKKMPKKKNQKY